MLFIYLNGRQNPSSASENPFEPVDIPRLTVLSHFVGICYHILTPST
jgi:hypothetical protein